MCRSVTIKNGDHAEPNGFVVCESQGSIHIARIIEIIATQESLVTSSSDLVIVQIFRCGQSVEPYRMPSLHSTALHSMLSPKVFCLLPFWYCIMLTVLTVRIYFAVSMFSTIVQLIDATFLDHGQFILSVSANLMLQLSVILAQPPILSWTLQKYEMLKSYRDFPYPCHYLIQTK